MKILIVDDVPAYLDALSRALGSEHCIVTAASLADAKSKTDDLVNLALIDARLSEEDYANRDGILLLGWIKESYPKIPIIIMSAYKDFDTAVDALNLGASYYLKKPINLRELRELIASLSKD